MSFEITQGNPTPEEVAALELAMSQHKREELVPVIRRSNFGQTQLRRPLAHRTSISARRYL